MNKQEKEFYDYLMRLPMNSFDQWLDNASDEQIELADRLMDEVRSGLFNPPSDYTEAKEVLKQFTLKG
jgi:hypothetical protein